MSYEQSIEIIRNKYLNEQDEIIKDALEDALNSLEKQIPLEPILKYHYKFICPHCKSTIGEKHKDGHYWDLMKIGVCYCGQKIRWDKNYDELDNLSHVKGLRYV